MFSIHILAVLALVTTGLAYPAIVEERASLISMGSAATFGVVAATTITNTGATVVDGICGVSPGSAIVGFLPGVCSGGNSVGVAAPVVAAKAACTSAFNAASSAVQTKALSSANLAGQNLAPGVYTFPALGVTLTADLTLNGATNPSGQWIFKITETLVTSALSKVILTGGALASNVFFLVGSSATLGAGSSLAGNILAHTAVSLGGAAVVDGTICAITAAITLDDNSIVTQ